MHLDPRIWLLSLPAGMCLIITTIRWRYHVRKGDRREAASISGVVVADGDDPVIELVLDLEIPHLQTGMSVEETHRELRARPFRVRTEAGELVDVEPPRDVKLHAELGRAQKIEHMRRYKKTAKICAGERVFLTGHVRDAASPEGGPFREGVQSHRQIAPTTVSTENPGAPAQRSAASDKKWLVRWLLMTAVGPLPYVLPIVPLFVIGFWLRDMIVAKVWWDQKRYSEWYGSGTTSADRAEYH